MPTSSRPLLLTFALPLFACGASYGGNPFDFSGGFVPHADGGGALDDAAGMLPDGDFGLPPGTDLSVVNPGGNCDMQHPCGAGKRCYLGACIADNGTCTSDSDCQNDSYCSCASGGGDMGACAGGICVPWGNPPRGTSNPNCAVGQAFSPSDFKPPMVKCSWTGASVISTPVVIDLDLDGKPEIVFVTIDPAGALDGMLVAIHGTDCSVVFQKNASLADFSQLAAADLDGDKYPEIVGLKQMGGGGNTSIKVVVFDHAGNLLASSPKALPGALGSDCSGAAIVDVDGMAPPEIVVGGQVLRYVKGQAALTVLFSNGFKGARWGTLTAAADLDGDGVPEIITGHEVFDGKTGATKTPAGWSQLGGTGAYPAVADLNHDKKPDVILIQSSSTTQTAWVWDWANQKFIFGPLTLPNTWPGGVPMVAAGGPPTVADFDGDGTPDFGSAGSSNYWVFSMKCWPNGGPGCASKGILWQKSTHDISSGGTASSVFDFNGDGKAEVVYRDECFFRVLNGPDGKTDFAMQITSGTCLENPVVADVDGDGHAEVVVPADNLQQHISDGFFGTYDFCVMPAQASDPDTGQTYSSGNDTMGVYILRDPMSRWMPSRGIWNEHTYHITNVNDDGTIPSPETPNWSSWNDYRTNVQGMGMGNQMPGVDLTGQTPQSIDNGGMDCMSAERLWAQVCNRGAAPAAAGIPGTFYNADPRKMGATKLCTAITKGALMPGQCEQVYCDWKHPPQGPQNIWFRTNDDGTKTGGTTECNGDNNLLFQPNVQCYVPG